MLIDSSFAFLVAMRSAPWDLAAIVPDGGRLFSERLGNGLEVEGFVAKWNDIANLHYCPNPQKTAGVKATKQDIEAAWYLQSDLDPNDDEKPEDAKSRYLQTVARWN